jgi:hypothetical protein
MRGGLFHGLVRVLLMNRQISDTRTRERGPLMRYIYVCRGFDFGPCTVVDPGEVVTLGEIEDHIWRHGMVRQIEGKPYRCLLLVKLPGFRGGSRTFATIEEIREWVRSQAAAS